MRNDALIAEHLVQSLSTLVCATMVAENRHMVLRRPLDALQIKNYRAFTPTELIDVQTAADILTHDIMPIVRMTRPAARPALCETLLSHTSGVDGAIRENASRCASYGKD